MEVITKSAKETKELGKKIGTDLVRDTRYEIRDTAKIFALSGDLGSGKTTFVQGLAKGLGIKQRIISPTFILMRQYRIKLKTQNSKLKTKTKNLKHFYHIDLYRLENNIENELKNLGIDEIWSDPQNIVAIEWAEKARDFIPDYARWIKFEYVGEWERKIKEIKET